MSGPANYLQYLAINAGLFQPRLAQDQSLSWAAGTNEFGVKDDVRKRVELVTGYGKTLIAYGVFAVLKARGIVTRMLVIVPGDEQRSQFCDDEKDAKELLGVKCPARAIEKTSADFAYNRRNERCVFVATYGQLNDGFLKDLLSDGGTWMVVLDECHHLSEDNTWGERAESLPARFRLFMTATPLRSDRKSLRGMPTDDASLIAKADYQIAYREEAVKQVVCCNEHYQVLCDSSDGSTFPVTTTDLQKEKVKDFSTYEAKRQLRYNMDYLWELLLNPISMLFQKRAANPPDFNGTKPGRPKHQALIFAMSCRHASFVCEAVKSVCTSVGYSLSCDWVGVGEGYRGEVKNEKENREVIDKFRSGELDILISVDKIGEGFSVKTASVIVFLNLISADCKLLQQIGRGLRRLFALSFQDDVAHYYCGSDHPVSKILAVMEQTQRDVRKERLADGNTQQSLWDISDLTVVKADYSHREVICPVTPQDIAKYLSEYDLDFCRKHGLDPIEFYRHQIGRAGLAPKGFTDDTRSAQERENAIKSQTNTATTTLVGNIIKLMKEQGHPVNGMIAGKVKKSVNTAWLRRGGAAHDSMTETEWRNKHTWLKEENDRIRESRSIPSWVNLN